MRGSKSHRPAKISALSLGWASFMLSVAEACVQVTLNSIRNTGVITDYETNEDELSVWMGVGSDILYTWKSTMTANQERKFAPGLVTIPCFYDEVFYIEATEIDDFANDKSQVSLMCKNFQFPQTSLEVAIREDIGSIGNAANVVSGFFGTLFTFGLSDGGQSGREKTAKYVFTFDVVQNCALRPDQKDFVRTDEREGVIRFYSSDVETSIKPKIDAEYLAPAPVPSPAPAPEPSPAPAPAPESTKTEPQPAPDKVANTDPSTGAGGSEAAGSTEGDIGKSGKAESTTPQPKSEESTAPLTTPTEIKTQVVLKTGDQVSLQ